MTDYIIHHITQASDLQQIAAVVSTAAVIAAIWMVRQLIRLIRQAR